jgi:hypothetical protein
MESLAWLLLLAAPADAPERADRYFKIVVVDDRTGRGVPLVELETVNGLRYYTDTNGIVAFQEPGLMDQTVFFSVRSHGYEFPKDGFGFRGQALKVRAGDSATLKIKRLNVAERLYRTTGGGIYSDSVLVGAKTPLKEPLLNAQVLGSDSVVNAVFHGKLYWFWGDTNRPSYLLGNFQVPGATSVLPKEGGLDPERGVDLSYFVDAKGVAKETAPLPGAGPTWIGGTFVLRDEKKQERLFAGYVKIRKELEVYERGLVEFDDEAKLFRKVATFDLKASAYPQGHTFLHREGGVDYVYFANPFPLVRVRADIEAIRKAENYESFTCLKEGTHVEDGNVERIDGHPRYAWRKNTAPTGPPQLSALMKAGRLKSEECCLAFRDVVTGRNVQAHSGSVYWNEYRQRWVLIAVQSQGTSYLGEVWYAEADTPIGPWVYARKIVTHDKYSFYNPKQHPYFDKDKGRTIFFEGTYTHTFSGNQEKTPRYDYNQILYKLDLDDPRLVLPVPIYLTDSNFRTATVAGVERDPRHIAFFALERPTDDTKPVFEEAGVLKFGDTPKGTAILFHALPADATTKAETIPLYEYTCEDGKKHDYSVDPEWSRPGWSRSKVPLCRVWRNPLAGVFK